jgi:hypothetical protein
MDDRMLPHRLAAVGTLAAASPQFRYIVRATVIVATFLPDTTPNMPRNLLLATSLAFAIGSASAANAATSDLTTISERSGFIKTGRYDEVIALCDAFQHEYPKAVRCFDFGITPEGRPMKALAVSTSGHLDPQAARAANLPVLLAQGGIHAGEIDGKDAGFLLLREMLEGKAGKGVLDKLVVLFVPVFNVDGHERFAAWNRPNQRGPEQMGWRTTAQNYNLNRDYAKADAPEMHAMLALVNAWDPIACIDLHVTDGAKFQHDVSIQVEPVHAGDAALRTAGRAFRDAVIGDVKREGGLPVAFYPSFVENDNPASGFVDVVSPPRFSTGYFQLRNRFAMLVETHSWRDYPHRVKTTQTIVLSVVEQVAQHGRAWMDIAKAADARALAGQPVPLDYAATPKTRTIDFLGYEYTRTQSDVSGALMTHYDETKPQVWKLPLRDDVQPARTVDAPKAGYLVPAANAKWVGAKLALHDITFETLEGSLGKRDVQTFRATKRTFSSNSVEGHQRLEIEGEWKNELRDIGGGALFVPIAQPKARLVMALLEPQAPDALAAWGEFNNFFERKEYMEDYVAEAVAREMLEDPKVKAEFDAALKHEAFAKDPSARLNFFAQKHSSWDERFNLYPVYRLDATP